MTDIVALLQSVAPLVSKTTLRQMSRVIEALLSMTGRITMLGLSRWTEAGGSYRTIQRWYHDPLDRLQMQWTFFMSQIWKANHEYILAGAGINTTTAAFIQQATGGVGGNLLGNNTKITNPLSDGNPNAILIVTPNNDPEGVNAALTDLRAGVFYISGHWCIYYIDGSPISPGEAFNVLIINP